MHAALHTVALVRPPMHARPPSHSLTRPAHTDAFLPSSLLPPSLPPFLPPSLPSSLPSSPRVPLLPRIPASSHQAVENEKLKKSIEEAQARQRRAEELREETIRAADTNGTHKATAETDNLVSVSRGDGWMDAATVGCIDPPWYAGTYR
eukprot:GHVU01004584.1.p3 GENE.GHVU01004584.1~~GHVU01004584.1.p3  ORF type:complete len:149 (-),score=30.23 GHVU01004584.1:183-629(-)